MEHEIEEYSFGHIVVNGKSYIEIVTAPTERAVKYFNRLQRKKRTVGAFHLSC